MHQMSMLSASNTKKVFLVRFKVRNSIEEIVLGELLILDEIAAFI